jgi:hypothetical protein
MFVASQIANMIKQNFRLPRGLHVRYLCMVGLEGGKRKPLCRPTPIATSTTLFSPHSTVCQQNGEYTQLLESKKEI